MIEVGKTLAWAQKTLCWHGCERNLDGTPCSHSDLCAALRLALQRIDRSVVIDRTDLEEARKSLVILQMDAEGRAAHLDWPNVNGSVPLPGWLMDTKGSIETLTDALYPKGNAA